MKKSGGFFEDALKNALGFASGQAIYNGVGTAVNFITSNFGDRVKSEMDANRKTSILEGLKSTHGASGQTVDSLDNLSTSLMNMTGIDADAVKSAGQILLTFTGIGENAFPAATQAAADMATHMNAGVASG